MESETTHMERTFLVRCTKEQLIELGHYMNAQGIFFRKCSDDINEQAHAAIFPQEEEAEKTDGTLRDPQ